MIETACCITGDVLLYQFEFTRSEYGIAPRFLRNDDEQVAKDPQPFFD